MNRHPVLLLALFLISINCSNPAPDHREYLSIKGDWQFAMDPDDIGETEHWYLNELDDTITLPGTMDENLKGYKNRDTTTLHLNRLYKYEGAAWYRKKVMIPDHFDGKFLQLFLERTKTTRIWIDSTFIGESRILQSPHRHDVSEVLTPGIHYITLKIDNSIDLTPYRETHIFSDETQTNWNGVIGELRVEAMPKTHITDLQVYPDVGNRSIDIKLDINNGADLETADVELLVQRTYKGRVKTLPVKVAEVDPDQAVELSYSLGDESILWDEYDQPLYTLTVVLSAGELKDSKTVPFGMRNFITEGTAFKSNGRTIFLRGKNDAAVFPLTGYTPTDVESWKRVFEIAKSWGINHVRFHSYTPPEAAFTAADQVGIYMQTELPFWGGLDSTNVMMMLREEGFALLKEYANHPSFVMVSHGNEIWSGHDNVEANLKALKEYDDRPLYTMGSNNSIGYIGPVEGSDFFVGARTPSAGDTQLTHTRITHAFADSDDGGILNTQVPSTDFDFSYPVSQIKVPVISHEIGQYQIYPDYNEIDKYTGPVRAWNLEVFRNRLEKAGMMDLNKDFQKASGAWSAIAYKAEMEAAYRTPGMAGFQLLDLQDFPGQGTALVGILDAFMDDKKVIDKKVWRQSINDVVILGRFKKFVWTNEEKFTAEIEVANYSKGDLSKSLKWTLNTESGEIIESGELSLSEISQGGLTSLGRIDIDLNSIDQAQKLYLNLELPGTGYSNQYPVWVYPSAQKPLPDNDIIIAESFSDNVINSLKSGNKVLLFPSKEDVKNNSVGGLFPPNFWNYEMFKGISISNDRPYSPGTLGLLMDPEHPLFDSFPTEFHTNWQWFSMVKASNPLILDQTDDEYRPIVQVVDNLQRNHKLGFIFELKVGNGKLLVCMSRLSDLSDKPEAKQLYRSILNYMDSENFNPVYEIAPEDLNSILFPD